jgi:bis(5'-nucleosyl)-tetraphosphatase (symmetrical)
LSYFAIGDVQGCARSLSALLGKLPSDARLIFCGDLINRGPRSLETLDILMCLGTRAQFVLGNHDLHFLAAACGARKPSKSDTLKGLLKSPKMAMYVDWLRAQNLAISLEIQGSENTAAMQNRRHLVVHAGVVPQWGADQTLALADEVCKVLRGPDWQSTIRAMYSNQPNLWSDELKGMDRLRFIINVLTRTRYVFKSGALELESKEGPDSAPEGTLAWFDHPQRATAHEVLVFGHWSTLGLMNRSNLIGLDTGCVWGGKLTAIELETRQIVQVDYQD